MEKSNPRKLSEFQFVGGNIIFTLLIVAPASLGLLRYFIPHNAYLVLIGIYLGVLASAIAIQFMKVKPYPPHKSRGFKIWTRDKKGAPV